ncbi:MAG: hypothetical protein NZX77_22270, partial [Polyangiaceae bacterium]|nr:hypothetical protein [Polyangiaceae bacterium]
AEIPTEPPRSEPSRSEPLAEAQKAVQPTPTTSSQINPERNPAWLVLAAVLMVLSLVVGLLARR